MSIIQVFVPLAGATLLLGAVVLFAARSFYRARIAPRVRAAMNDAYESVQFMKENHLPELCDSHTLEQLQEAIVRFKDAEAALKEHRYKRCIKLAKHASALISSLRPQIVCRRNPKPIPPSLCVISHPDNLIWMG